MKLYAAGQSGSKRSALLLGIALCTFAAPGLAQAQEEAQPAAPQDQAEPVEGEGNEIVITATKREKTLQDTPVAVSVTTASTIERAQIRDITDLSSVVPSLKVSQNQSQAATSYAVRGFGTSGNNLGLEPSVAVFVDGVYRSRAISQISDLPEIQRVEVLRGPQSTLFGKNASAGVISIVTREPSYNFGGSVEGSYGNYNAAVVKGYITGGLTDTIAASISAGYNRRDGYLTNAFNGDDMNNRNRWFARGQLRFDPTDNLKVRLIADYDKIDEKCCGVVNLRPSAATGAVRLVGGQVNSYLTPFDDVVYSDVVPTSKVRNWGLSGQIDYTMGPLTLTSITAYRDTKIDAAQDVDFTSAALASGANIGHAKIHTFTQELRIASNLEGPVNFLLGGYYFNEKLNTADQIVYGKDFRPYVSLLIQGATGGALNANSVEALIGAPANTFWQSGQGFFNQMHQKDEAWSVFGNVDLKPIEDLTITLGGNYTHDAKDVSSNSRSTDLFSAVPLPAAFAALKPIQFLPPFLNFPNAVESGKTRDGKWTYNARVAYKINRGLNVYASYATGFKASSFNLSRDSRPTAADLATIIANGGGLPNLAAGSRFAAPEESTVYEAGIKGNWGLASANLTVFKQSIKNFQTNTFTGTGFLFGNAEKQSTFGIEFDGRVNPTRELTLSLAMTYLDPKYDSFKNSPWGDISGQHVLSVSKLSASFGAQWDKELGNSDHVIARGDFNYTAPAQVEQGLLNFGSTAANLAIARPFRSETRDLNASLTWAMHNGLELTVWGRNLLDYRSITDIFDSVAQAGSISGYINQPRTYGVAAKFKF
ncbi:MAG: TonB-dependent receptor [Proteobacteria bacterium]|nr:TonB-dependent receptor [Pseudomonadota bacterium]